MSEFRRLQLIKKSGSTSRILNLHTSFERFGSTESYKEQPFFANRKLNSAIIVKHTLRAAESYLFAKPTRVATKVILPFNALELDIGATNIFVNQVNFEKALWELVGGYNDQTLARDSEMLRTLAALPSLDPFILRERLKQTGKTVSRCYFQISDADMDSMQSYVSLQISQLILKAFSGDSNVKAGTELAAQMASKILSDENTESLEPLRASLGLSGQEWSEGVFCWKGFLYYKWTFLALLASAKKVAAEMNRISLSRCDESRVQDLTRMRERAIKIMREHIKSAGSQLEIYDKSFKAMTDDGEPNQFRQFLLKSPDMFLEIGESVGIVSHICSFWSFKFTDGIGIPLDGAELIEVFQEVESCSATDSGTKPTQMVW